MGLAVKGGFGSLVKKTFALASQKKDDISPLGICKEKVEEKPPSSDDENPQGGVE